VFELLGTIIVQGVEDKLYEVKRCTSCGATVLVNPVGERDFYGTLYEERTHDDWHYAVITR
jgi:hypothetical protein